jgi:GNAT superfamily N-acetyltransferase
MAAISSAPDTARPARKAPASRVIVVRAATTDDLDAVMALRLALVREESRRVGRRTNARDMLARARHIYSLQLSNQEEATLLAFAATRAVGVLRCTISTDSSPAGAIRYAFLTSGYVVPSQRRRGVMHALLQAADAWCRTRALQEMRLQVQWENVVGNAAWDALGFAPHEVRRRRLVPSG